MSESEAYREGWERIFGGCKHTVWDQIDDTPEHRNRWQCRECGLVVNVEF